VAEEIEKLEFDYERDLERLRQREVEPEDRLAAALAAQREAAENRADAERRLRALPGPLFAAESLRLRQALVAADREIARESAKIEKARRDLAKIASRTRPTRHRPPPLPRPPPGARPRPRHLRRYRHAGGAYPDGRWPPSRGLLPGVRRRIGKEWDRSTREPAHETLRDGGGPSAGTTGQPGLRPSPP
jgi:hypothetical protein